MQHAARTDNHYDLSIKVNGMEFSGDSRRINLGGDGLVTVSLLEKTPYRYDFMADGIDVDYRHIVNMRDQVKIVEASDLLLKESYGYSGYSYWQPLSCHGLGRLRIIAYINKMLSGILLPDNF